MRSVVAAGKVVQLTENRSRSWADDITKPLLGPEARSEAIRRLIEYALTIKGKTSSAEEPNAQTSVSCCAY